MRRHRTPRARLAAALVVAGVGSVTLVPAASAADGPPPIRTGFTIHDLKAICASMGGDYSRDGSSALCVLPSGTVFFCRDDGSRCVALRQAPKSTGAVGGVTDIPKTRAR